MKYDLSMQLERCEGIVIHAYNFGDYDKIINVFTLEYGLSKFILKGANKSSASRLAANPFVCAEFIFQKGNSDLWPCREINVIEPFNNLRNSISCLESAGLLLKAVQSSQLLHKMSSRLYLLLRWSLNKVSLVKDPFSLAASFYLKILSHDGLFQASRHCNECHIPLAIISTYRGELFCSTHAPEGALAFSQEESDLIQQLIIYSNISEIENLILPPLFFKKIQELFGDSVS